MYFIFNHEIRSWRNQIVQARILHEPPEIKPHWWTGKALQTSLPTIQFSINQKAPITDNFFTGTIFDLYSERLVNLFHNAGIKFETFPVQIINWATQKTPNLKYHIFHLLEIHSGLDKNRSDLGDDEIRKLVLTPACLRACRPLFRLRGLEDIVLIHQRVKSILDNAGITGCSYIPVEKFRTGIRFDFEDMKRGTLWKQTVQSLEA